MALTAEQLARLPKWAQDAIADLDRDVQHQAAEIRDLQRAMLADQQIGPGVVEIDPYGVPAQAGHHCCFPPGMAVRFHANEEHRAFTVRLQDGELRILYSMGQIYVLPNAANSISVKVAP